MSCSSSEVNLIGIFVGTAPVGAGLNTFTDDPFLLSTNSMIARDSNVLNLHEPTNLLLLLPLPYTLIGIFAGTAPSVLGRTRLQMLPFTLNSFCESRGR